MLEPQLIALLQRSSTFRRQCAVIAATTGPARDDSHRHTETPGRQGADDHQPLRRPARFARRSPSGSQRTTCEVLPHEFEHIVEQVEGVSLPDEVAADARGVRRTARSRRGAPRRRDRAREEYEALAPGAIHMDSAKTVARKPPFYLSEGRHAAHRESYR